MRPEAAWSMSTVGLTAQETSFPLDNPFLWGSCFHSMDSKSSWGFSPEAAHSLKSAYSDPKGHSHHRDSPPLSPSVERHKPIPVTARLPKKSYPTYLSMSFTPEPSLPSPPEDKQPLLLPGHQGISPPHTPSRCSKPLPPLPLSKDSGSQLSLDSDEHFTVIDDSRRLVAEPVVKPVRFGLGRQSLRLYGQDNRAFCDHGPQRPRPAPTQPRPQSPRPQSPRPAPTQSLQPQQTPYLENAQQTPPLQRRHESRHDPHQDTPRQQREDVLLCSRQLDRTQRRVRRTQSGPAGSFNKPSFLNQSKRSTYRPEVPPPVPPRLSKTEDPRRWSMEVSGAYSDEDRPPKLPPRGPLSRSCSRTNSDKTLPLYMNGEMPQTQSFAPDPKYVSYQRQNSEGSPCIYPVIVGGQKDSGTHYFLLDGPPPHATDSEWEYSGRKKPAVDLV